MKVLIEDIKLTKVKNKIKEPQKIRKDIYSDHSRENEKNLDTIPYSDLLQ